MFHSSHHYTIFATAGNRRLLNYDTTWEALLDHYEEKECIVSAHSFPSKAVLKKLPPVV